MADTDTKEPETQVDPDKAEADAKAKEESGRRASRPRIKEAVMEVLEELGVIGDDGDKKDEEPDPDKKDDEPEGPRQQEARAEQGVAEALKAVLKEHDHEKEHEALKAEKIVEEAPAQVSKLTRFFWGDGKS